MVGGMTRERHVRSVTVLSVPDCPNAPLLMDRLRQVLAGRSEVTVVSRVVADQAGAERGGMHGSPTLLIDGVDPFAAADQPCSLSCRLYRHPGGYVDGAPSLAELRVVVAMS